MCEAGYKQGHLEAERESSIYADPQGSRDPFEQASDSWLAYMLRDLTRGLSKADLVNAFENVSIINFNYDRCVEHFCYHWFQRIYDLSEAESADVCNRIKIYHPYGSLGTLPYQGHSANIPYGGEIRPHRLIEMADRIRTYSEAVADDDPPSDVLAGISSAKRIVFLGFGFHVQNVRLLGSSATQRRSLRCYATIDGIRAPRLELIKAALASELEVQDPGFFFEGVRGNCEAFWDEYGDLIVN